MRYLVVVEKGPTSFGAYVPDLPGCVVAGETRDEVLALNPFRYHPQRVRSSTSKRPN